MPDGTTRRGVSDISRKQLERIVNAENCQVILLFDDDAAVVFRGDTVETLVPPSVREAGPEAVPQSARNVLLTLALFQNPALMETAEAILAEAQKILNNDDKST